MTVKLLTEQHLEFLRSKGGCTGLSGFIHVENHIVGDRMSWLIFVRLQGACFIVVLIKCSLFTCSLQSRHFNAVIISFIKTTKLH